MRLQNLGFRCVQVPSLEAADVEAEACAVVPGPPDCKPVGILLKKWLAIFPSSAGMSL